MSRSTVLVFLFAAMVALGVSTLVYLQSYNGRQDIVAAQRANCFNSDDNFVIPVADSMEAEQQLNLAASGATSLAPSLRARAKTVEQKQAQQLLNIDKRIDPSAPKFDLLDPIDQAVVHHLGSKAFRCDKVYPNTPPFSLLR